MRKSVGWVFGISIAACLLALTGCDLTDKIDQNLERDEPVIVKVPQADLEDLPADTLPEPVQAKLDTIKATLETNSLRSLVRLASLEEDFRSNYGDLGHYDHWYILKRAGIDPIIKTEQILELDYGVKDFGAVKYYIWPELASRPPEDLVFSRLSFKERAMLLELVGESGVEDVKNGEPYPGFKLAIREDGSWAYLLQEY